MEAGTAALEIDLTDEEKKYLDEPYEPRAIVSFRSARDSQS
jgi:hypothetical protein